MRPISPAQPPLGVAGYATEMGRAASRGRGPEGPPKRRRIYSWAASALFSCNCSLSAISAMNSELVGFPLVLDTV